MNSVGSVSVEVAVVLGTASMPIHQLLRMGRGAVIELTTDPEDKVELLANNVPVAKGEVVVSDNKIAIEVTDTLTRQDIPE